MMGVTYGFPCLCTALMSVACSQFDKLKATILLIRQQHSTPQHGQEVECNVQTANSNLQVKLNACIRHHQDILE